MADASGYIGVPMFMKKKVRDTMLAFSEEVAKNLEEDILREYPEMFQDDPAAVTVTSDKKGSNQYAYKGKVLFKMEHEAFEKLEKGGKYKPFEGTFIQNVGSHQRELGKPKGRIKKIARKLMRQKPKRASVKGHTRTYKNMKPVKLASGEWRILKGTPATKGKKIVRKKLRQFLTEKQIASFIVTNLE